MNVWWSYQVSNIRHPIRIIWIFTNWIDPNKEYMAYSQSSDLLILSSFWSSDLLILSSTFFLIIGPLDTLWSVGFMSFHWDFAINLCFLIWWSISVWFENCDYFLVANFGSILWNYIGLLIDREVILRWMDNFRSCDCRIFRFWSFSLLIV